jgi:N-methylhydantoinase A
VAFGGGAPLHACRLAEKIGITKIIVPNGAGVGSAIGFLKAPIAYEITKSAAFNLDRFDAAAANILLKQMTKDAEAVVKPALKKAKSTLRIVADCRYVGQGHEIKVTIPIRALTKSDGAKLKAAFEKTYAQIYGLTIPGQAAEAITWSVTSSSKLDGPVTAKSVPTCKPGKPLRHRKIYDPSLGRLVAVPVYWRFDLTAGMSFKGPAIIAEYETSTIVGSRFNAKINNLGYIILERK